MFNDVSYYEDNVQGASQNGLERVFSFGIGIYVVATVHNCILKR